MLFLMNFLLLFNVFDNAEYKDIYLKGNFENEITRDLRIVQIDSILYQYRERIIYDCFITFYNIKDTNDLFIIELSDSLSMFKECDTHIGGIVARNDTIFVAYVNKLLLFKYEKYGICPLINQINLYETFPKNNAYYARKLFIDKNEIIGMGESFIQQSSKLDSNNNYKRIPYDYQDLFVWRYNFKDSSRNILKYFDYPKGFYWTNIQPRNCMDYCDNQYLQTDITEYKIRIYDDNFNLIDSIERNLPNWISLTENIEKHTNGYGNIADLQSNIYIKSLINRVNFITKDRILVCYSMKDEEFERNSNKLYNLVFDVWEKINGKWELTESDLDETKYKKVKSENGYFHWSNYNIYNNLLYSVKKINREYKLIISEIK